MYLSKEQIFENIEEFQLNFERLKDRKEKLTHENILQIKEVIGKNTDGFFSTKKKLITVFDYPFSNLYL